MKWKLASLLLGAGAWLSWMIVWWAASGPPRQTIILWDRISMWEWALEGALFHALFVLCVYLSLRK